MLELGIWSLTGDGALDGLLQLFELDGFRSQAIHADRRCSDPLMINRLIEILVRLAHVRVFRLVADLRRKFRVAGMNVRNV